MRSFRIFALAYVLVLVCLQSPAHSDHPDAAVVMVEGCSGVCVDPAGLVLTAKHCELSETVTVRFKDRTVTAHRLLTSSECEGPVVYDCDGDGYPYLSVAASPPRIGERLWSCGFPQVNGRRELSWNSGRLLHWSTFQYGGGSFNGNVVGFATCPGWSGGPLLNGKSEVCGLLNSTNGSTSVFISSAAVRAAYAAAQQQLQRKNDSDAGRLKLFVFGSMTCGPCRQFKDDYANNSAFRSQLEAVFAVEFIDIDKQPELAGRIGIEEVPTFLAPGVIRITGYDGPDELLTQLGI
ncbi:MAG: trypsin-like peptidase domain-containing protein, partial [Planctomycetaceae bacterium]|nr:trypsin-like peptidase domain-containing protein [Planctomycetaceae bacterium]